MDIRLLPTKDIALRPVPARADKNQVEDEDSMKGQGTPSHYELLK